jgi:hypothetical protein
MIRKINTTIVINGRSSDRLRSQWVLMPPARAEPAARATPRPVARAAPAHKAEVGTGHGSGVTTAAQGDRTVRGDNSAPKWHQSARDQQYRNTSKPTLNPFLRSFIPLGPEDRVLLTSRLPRQRRHALQKRHRSRRQLDSAVYVLLNVDRLGPWLAPFRFC